MRPAVKAELNKMLSVERMSIAYATGGQAGKPKIGKAESGRTTPWARATYTIG